MSDPRPARSGAFRVIFGPQHSRQPNFRQRLAQGRLRVWEIRRFTPVQGKRRVPVQLLPLRS